MLFIKLIDGIKVAVSNSLVMDLSWGLASFSFGHIRICNSLRWKLSLK